MRGNGISQGVQDIARQLGVSLAGGGDPTVKIVAACRKKVDSWCEELGPVESYADLLDVVSAKLKVHFEVVQSDDELRSLRDRYLKAREAGFINLDREFDNATDAVVLKLVNAEKWSSKQYVAVVDARGPKAPRQWFSQWHELAHLIAEPQTKFVFRRTQASKRDPVERLMDQIAGQLAFYPPLFLPALEMHRIDLSRPTLASIVEFRDDACPFASLQSTIAAVLRHVPVPAILVEARNELKSSERAEASGARAATPQLRAVTTTHNAAAIAEKFYIHRWMRVPHDSVIWRVYDGNLTNEARIQEEDLSWWESQGAHLPEEPLLVDAMTAGNGRVLALVTRKNTKKPTRKRYKAQGAPRSKM